MAGESGLKRNSRKTKFIQNYKDPEVLEGHDRLRPEENLHIKKKHFLKNNDYFSRNTEVSIESNIAQYPRLSIHFLFTRVNSLNVGQHMGQGNSLPSSQILGRKDIKINLSFCGKFFGADPMLNA